MSRGPTLLQHNIALGLNADDVSRDGWCGSLRRTAVMIRLALRSPNTRLTFLSTGNPTGLKFLVERGGRSCLFDFGLEHSPGSAPFSHGLHPRPGRELEDLLAVGAAPRLGGVYEAWDGRVSVFISHLHLDHTALLRFLHRDVPIYYPEAMEPLRAASHASGYLTWREPPGFPVPDRGRIRVGEIEVEFVAVDHDLPGATGFVVRAPDLVLAYTGDHRWHGFHPDLTAGFARAARGVDVLVLEAVSLGLDPPAPGAPPSVPASERDVVAGFAELIGRTTGLVVVNLYPMNRERVHAFAAEAAARGRLFLMEERQAIIAGWPHVFTDVAAVRAEPRRYCLALPFDALPTLIDLRPPPGSVYLHCNGAPLGPFDPAFAALRGWPALFGMDLVLLSSSGHSWPGDLVRMVDAVRPAVVVPVHSRNPERLETPGVACLVPKPGRTYTSSELVVRPPLAGRGEDGRGGGRIL